MQESRVSMYQFTADRADKFWAMLDTFRFQADREYYERCLERQSMGELAIILAELDDDIVGYCILNWQPKYAYFKKCELPEIQDLNVLPSHRRQGIGETLIRHCEGLARENGHAEMGIGVGLDASFGAAQRLYARLGYIPDGSGVSYDRKQVAAGEFRPVDENLCLMMTKTME